MKLKFKPTTKYGKLSVKFLLGNVVLFGITQVFYIYKMATSVPGVETADNPILRIPLAIIGATGLVFGVVAFFTGAYAFFKEKERGLFIYISLLLGVSALVFILGELLIPH